MITDIKIQAKGRWSGVFVNLGIPEHVFNGKHQDCILCQDTHKNARWNKTKEYWVCSKCGVTQPMDIAMLCTGENFKLTAAKIRGERLDKMTAVTQQDDSAKNLARIQKIHKGLKRITPDCPVAKYIANRGLSVLPETDCYYHPEIAYYHEDKKKTQHPGMVSYFRNLGGEIVTAHINYLTEDGNKADVETVKKVLPVARPLPGSAIRLFKAAPILAITEGIETALAVHQDQGIAVWAAGNASNMEKIQLPEEVKEVWIYADSDANFTGQNAAYTLAKRLTVIDKKLVRVVLLIDGKEHTDKGGNVDFLDHLLSARLAQ